MTRTLALILALTGVLGAQDPADGLVAELHGVLTAPVRTEEDVTRRAAGARAWLERVHDLDTPRVGFLRILARYHAAVEDGARRGSLDDLVEHLRRHEDRLPVPDFRPLVANLMLLYGIATTNAGEFELAQAELPRILALQDDRRSTYWLLGRRGRDHGSDAGRAFLQQTIIPAILADHVLDDTDRVYLLRRLYTVDYTGPRPFRHVAGPTVGGARASSADLEGDVLMVMYWATW